MFAFNKLATLSAIAALSEFVSAACDSFVPITRPNYSSPTYSTTSNYSYPVSRGIHCPAATDNQNQTCSGTGGGWVTAYGTLNITTLNHTAIYKLISDTIDRTLNVSTTGTLNNFTFDVQPGASVYYAFTPFLLCVEGRLNGCDADGDIMSNTAVQACGPYYINDDIDEMGFGILHGAVSRMSTSDDITERLPCNLANSTTAKAGMNPSDCTGDILEQDSSKHNAAPDVSNPVGLLVLSLTAVFVLM
jgi:hypothetical protein